MGSKADEVRAQVAADYTKAVKREGGCCSPLVPKGVIAKIADYRAEELVRLPEDAVANAFGCGNPVAFAAVQAGQTVLDLGSGAGIDLLLAAKKVGPTGQVIGVDMTDAMVARARANVAAAGLSHVEVRQGIIEALPVESASVDWVISNCVINLSPEKARVFAEIARVLRAGGTLLVSDIVAQDLPEEVTANRHLYVSCLAGAISEDDYLEGLRRAGLCAVEIVDKVVYDAHQVQALIGSELNGEHGSGCCSGGTAAVADLSRRWAERLSGKIASIKVRAHKPR